MATLSSQGIGSGLDISGMITKLMAVEQQPLTALQQKEASYQAKLSAYGTLQGTVASLQTAAQALTSSATFTGMSATVADSTIFSASASSSAASGTYTIGVSQLAKNQVLSSLGNYGSADTFKGGSLAITVGTTTTNVTITDGSSLSTMAQAINGANAGINAAVINAGPPGNYNRLVLTSATTGSAGAISLAVTQTGTTGTQNLTDFAYGGTDTATMQQAQAADNAIFTVNNVSLTRTSNIVTDAIDGVTLNLAKAGTVGAPVTTQLNVTRNTQTIQANITSFVNAYNAVVKQAQSLSAYDATNKKASVLTGDSIIQTLQSQLPNLLQTRVSGLSGSISYLSDIGIALQKDGTLSVDSAKLQAALSDTAKDVTGLFSSTATGNNGVAVAFNSALTSMLGSAGLFASRTDGINRTIKDLTNQEDAWQTRLTQIQARYQAQFNALDSLVASMNSTSTYLTQQLTALNNLAYGTSTKSSG